MKKIVKKKGQRKKKNDYLVLFYKTRWYHLCMSDQTEQKTKVTFFSLKVACLTHLWHFIGYFLLIRLTKIEIEATKRATNMFFHIKLSVDSTNGIKIGEIWRYCVEIIEKQAKTAIGSILEAVFALKNQEWSNKKSNRDVFPFRIECRFQNWHQRSINLTKMGWNYGKTRKNSYK